MKYLILKEKKKTKLEKKEQKWARTQWRSRCMSCIVDFLFFLFLFIILFIVYTVCLFNLTVSPQKSNFKLHWTETLNKSRWKKITIFIPTSNARRDWHTNFDSNMDINWITLANGDNCLSIFIQTNIWQGVSNLNGRHY